MTAMTNTLAIIINAALAIGLVALLALLMTRIARIASTPARTTASPFPIRPRADRSAARDDVPAIAA